MIKIGIAGLLFIFAFALFGQKMTFHSATIGTTAAHTRLTPYTTNGESHLNHVNDYTAMINIHARLATSIWERCHARHMRRFVYGDVLWGEVGTGVAQAIGVRNIHQSFFPTFDFGIGFGGIYRINEKNDVGMELGMLRFARTLTTFNYTGCHVRLKYRYSHLQMETALHNWNEYYLTWLYIFTPRNNPMHLSFALKYIISAKKLAGIHLETNHLYTQKPLLTPYANEKFWQLSLFYGFYF